MNSVNTATALVVTDCVLAAGPITMQPSTKPYRLVIVASSTELCVTQQIFDVNRETVTDLYKACRDAAFQYETGAYFPIDRLADAQRSFAERLLNHCDFVQSINRPNVDASV